MLLYLLFCGVASLSLLKEGTWNEGVSGQAEEHSWT
jgi:hypothetical protein